MNNYEYYYFWAVADRCLLDRVEPLLVWWILVTQLWVTLGVLPGRLELVSRSRLAWYWRWILRLRLSQCLRRLGATNRHCSVFRCALPRRKTTHKITCDHCWLFDFELHTGHCCLGQL